MPTIKFFTRSNNDINKTNVLYCRVRCNGSTSEFSTKQKIDVKFWNQTSQIYKSKNKIENIYISTLIDKLTYKLRFSAIDHLEPLSASELIKIAFGFEKHKTVNLLINLLVEFVEDIEQHQKSKSGTITNHKIKIENIRQFEIYNKKKYTADTFDCVTAESFIDWFCKTKRTKNITTASRNVLFVRMALIWAQKKGKIKNFHFWDIKV